MTKEEAINVLKVDIESCAIIGDLGEDIEANRMAIDALEKQIPQKVLYKTTSTHLRGAYSRELIFGCPACERAIFSRGRQYCVNCGQALDWSEVDK